MPTTDYSTLTPAEWEDLGRRLREAQAEVSSPVIAEVTAGLQGHSVRELRDWRDSLIQQRSDLNREAVRRSAYLGAAISRIDGALNG